MSATQYLPGHHSQPCLSRIRFQCLSATSKCNKKEKNKISRNYEAFFKVKGWLDRPAITIDAPRETSIPLMSELIIWNCNSLFNIWSYRELNRTDILVCLETHHLEPAFLSHWLQLHLCSWSQGERVRACEWRISCLRQEVFLLHKSTQPGKNLAFMLISCGNTISFIFSLVYLKSSLNSKIINYK